MPALVLVPVLGIWLLICAGLSFKIPRWMGANRLTWLWTLLLFPLLCVAPLLDVLVGMYQFRALCYERSKATISPAWVNVKRARVSETDLGEMPNSWITVRGYRTVYTDLDTGAVFMSFETFSTKGGRLDPVRAVGGTHSCPREIEIQLMNQLSRMKINELLQRGTSQ